MRSDRSGCAAKSQASSATSSGHCYFTLKDENACIDAVIWRTSAGALAFRPEDGAEVIATGKLTTYPGRSKYQVVVDRMELAGEGRCWLCSNAAARRSPPKACSTRPQAAPALPAAGYRSGDFADRSGDPRHHPPLEDRCPTQVIVWPVPVQGEGAAGQNCRGDPRLSVDRAAPRFADRRARRRLDRGSVAVQRGGSGAGRGQSPFRSFPQWAMRPTPP